MENPRSDKVAVVDEVRERLGATSAALLTEYRGLDVVAIGELRRALTAAGGDFKIYKNTLVRLAVRALDLDLEELLTGPTAIAFVTERPDGSPGDAVDVAKALRDFARGNPSLVVKGGMLGSNYLTAQEARSLADVESREVLLAKLAGAMAAPMVQLAGLMQALPRNLAYGLAALIEDRGGVPEAPAEPETADPETADPETADPETADPETADPEPETAEPETAEPETADPETADPEPETAEPEPVAEIDASDQPTDATDAPSEGPAAEQSTTEE